MSLSITWAGNTLQETIPGMSRNSIKPIKKHRLAQPQEYFPPQWALWPLSFITLQGVCYFVINFICLLYHTLCVLFEFV